VHFRCIDSTLSGHLDLDGASMTATLGISCFYHDAAAALLNDTHFLVPAMGTASVGFPFHPYIRIAANRGAYLENAWIQSVLVDGPSEGKEILNAKSQLGSIHRALSLEMTQYTYTTRSWIGRTPFGKLRSH